MAKQTIESNETTNSVLKEMIIGLTKITDDRLLNLKEGLADIKALVQGFVTIAQLEEVKKDFNQKIEDSNKNYNASIKRIEEANIQHNKDDKESFGALAEGQKKLNDTIKTWGGALLLAAFALPILIPIILHYIFKW